MDWCRYFVFGGIWIGVVIVFGGIWIGVVILCLGVYGLVLFFVLRGIWIGFFVCNIQIVFYVLYLSSSMKALVACLSI